MTPHEPFRELTAAYVLGALQPDERRRFERHLEGCERCRGDVISFSPLPGLLSRIPLVDLEGAAAPDRSAAVVAAARSELRRLHTSRRRWQLLAGVAAAFATAVLGLALVIGGDDDPAGPSGVALRLSSDAGVAGAVLADERPWGTYVHVSVAELPARDWYELWVVDRAGEWHPAGSWLPTAERRANLGSSTSLRLPEIERLVITSGDRADELAVAA